MVKDFIFYILGGLGFFFFGMQIMSEGLKKLAGERLKAILNMVTKLPVVGVLVGTAVTCLIQSSSATTVMVVGFVNAGLLALKQAIAVVMGANIGTTFTAWLVSSMSVFKITHYALPFVGAGFAIKAFGRTKNVKFWGQVIMGFGILFIGLSFMRDAFGPLRDSQYVRDILVTFCHNPLLGVLVGIIITVLLQSSSATIAIVQVLAFNGLLSFPAAVPIILGDNIGTTITAQLAAMGTSVNARRTAMAHSIFNIIGVSYMLIFVYNGWFIRWINFIIPGEMTLKGIMFYIAVSHSFFNIVNTLIFLPFINWLEKLCIILVPKKKGAIEAGPQYLEKRLLNTPTIAIEQARREIARMLNIASKSVSSAMKSFLDSDLSQIKQISEMEQMVDGLQSVITEYLVDISQKDLSDNESDSLPVLIHSVNDAERIGDHAENIVEFAERRAGEKLPFTDEAMKEINLMWNELRSMMTEAESALLNNNYDMAESVLSREKNINRLQVDLKKSHVDRLNEGKCNIKSGIIFLDLVDNMEKIGDHLTNIAQGVLEEMRWKDQKDHAGFKKTAFN